MGMCKPSGGKYDVYGPYRHSLPGKFLPNTRIDYYDEKTGKLLQQRWYGPDGLAIWDRDWSHGGGEHEWPHDHFWIWTNPKHPDRPPYIGLNGEKTNRNYC